MAMGRSSSVGPRWPSASSSRAARVQAVHAVPSAPNAECHGTEGGHMVTCFWILTLLGSLIGGLIVFGTLVSAEGAPQEAAGAALGLSFAIIP